MDESSYRYEMDEPVAFPPRRVVSLVPGVTESLFELGLGDRVIAVTEQCVYPEDGVACLRKIGGAASPDLDAIIALGPELVIANPDVNRRQDIETLQAAGLAIWMTFPRTVRDAFNMLWNIMHIFDEPAMVERVRSTEWVADWLERMSAARERPCRVFAPLAFDPLVTFSADTYSSDLLRVCGATNVFAGHTERYPRVSVEDVIAAQPDIVVLPDAPAADIDEQMARFMQLDIPAARAGQMARVDRASLTWPGTRVARALSLFPALLCPQKVT